MFENKLYEEIGKIIKEHREDKLITQQVLGEKVNLTRASIANIEKGRQKISIFNLYQIANILEASPCSLLPKDEILNVENSSLNFELEKVKETASKDLYNWIENITLETNSNNTDGGDSD